MIEKQAIKSFLRPGNMVSGAIAAPSPSAVFRFFRKSSCNSKGGFPNLGKPGKILGSLSRVWERL
jgi:hypothetical protein